MTRSTHRAGFTLIESCSAAALLIAALSLAVALLTGVARQRQAASLHAQAVLTADNLLERITAEPYESITSEHAEQLLRDQHLSEVLPESEAKIDISTEGGPPPGKRIIVEIAWQPRAGGPAARHRVASWVYRAEGKE
jgi:Tfp pilus assembly protein PilV